MKSTISTLTVVNATKSNVKDSKLEIKKLTKLLKEERKTLNSLKLPSKRKLKQLLDVKTPGSESQQDRNWKPGMNLPKVLNTASLGVTLFTAPAWLPDFAQKHLKIDMVNLDEKKLYEMPGTRRQKYEALLRQKKNLNWFERHVQRQDIKYDELLHFTKYGRKKAYTADGRGTTPTTPTFLEGDSEWQGELTLAERQDLKDKSVKNKFDVRKYRESVEKFEKVFYRHGQPILIAGGGGQQQGRGYAMPASAHRHPGVPANTRGPLPPGMRYSSTGGRIIQDPGGSDYGTRGGMGSRSSTRVHGADGVTSGHTGEDYAMPENEPLTMIAPGVVYDVGIMGDARDPGGPNGNNGGYGNFVVIKLDDGMYVKMAHLNEVSVRVGERVGAGSAGGDRAKVVGLSGNTGLSSGPHLHLDYAQRYDRGPAKVYGTVNPAQFIAGGGLVIGENVQSSGQTTQQEPPGVPANSAGTIAQPQSPVIPSAQPPAASRQPAQPAGPVDPYSEAAGADRKSVVQEKMDALQEEIDDFDEQIEGVSNFMDATREGSGLTYRNEYGSIVRGKHLGVWNKDKLFRKDGTEVNLKTKTPAQAMIDRLEKEKQKRVNQLNTFKSNVAADPDYIWSLNPQEQASLEADLEAIGQWQEDVAAGRPTTANPVLPSTTGEVPRQYPSYNTPQSAGVNNNTILVQQPAQAPVNIFSQAPQPSGASAPQQTVSISQIMSGILLTQLSGS